MSVLVSMSLVAYNHSHHLLKSLKQRWISANQSKSNDIYKIKSPYKQTVIKKYQGAYQALNHVQKFNVDDLVNIILNKSNNYTNLKLYRKILTYLDTHYEYNKQQLLADLGITEYSNKNNAEITQLIIAVYHQHLINIPVNFSQINNKLVAQTKMYLDYKAEQESSDDKVNKLKNSVAYNFVHLQ